MGYIKHTIDLQKQAESELVENQPLLSLVPTEAWKQSPPSISLVKSWFYFCFVALDNNWLLWQVLW